jgi:hypothetical protein
VPGDLGERQGHQARPACDVEGGIVGPHASRAQKQPESLGLRSAAPSAERLGLPRELIDEYIPV